MYEAVVIGAGPAGLGAALVLGRQRRRALLVDDGRPRNAPAETMHMVVGRDHTPPARLLADGLEELRRYPSVEFRRATVVSITGERGRFRLRIQDGEEEIQAARLLLATGLADEPADIPGLRERWGTSVLHCPFCHGFETTGKRIAVIADAPAAPLAAYIADRFSEDVVLCTNGPVELPEPLAAALRGRGVRLEQTPIRAVEGEGEALRIRFADGTALDRQVIYHRAAIRQRSDLAERLGCELLADGAIRVDERGATSVPGVYAAGDAAHPAALPEDVTLVSPASGAGVRTAVWLEQDLFLESMAAPGA